MPSASVAVDRLPTRHGQQPRLGPVRDAVPGPVGERRRECLGERILGGGDIAQPVCEKGDQLAIALPRGSLGGIAGIPVAFPQHEVSRVPAHIAQIGRTSIAPWLVPGQRAAQDSAASRSGASIR